MGVGDRNTVAVAVSVGATVGRVEPSEMDLSPPSIRPNLESQQGDRKMPEQRYPK